MKRLNNISLIPRLTISSCFKPSVLPAVISSPYLTPRHPSASRSLSVSSQLKGTAALSPFHSTTIPFPRSGPRMHIRYSPRNPSLLRLVTRHSVLTHRGHEHTETHLGGHKLISPNAFPFITSAAFGRPSRAFHAADPRRRCRAPRETEPCRQPCPRLLLRARERGGDRRRAPQTRRLCSRSRASP